MKTDMYPLVCELVHVINVLYKHVFALCKVRGHEIHKPARNLLGV